MFGIPISLPFRLPVARGLAVFLALFTLLNIAGSHLSPGFDANSWWIDVAYLPHFAGSMSLAVAALALLCFGIGFPEHWVTRRLVSIAIAALTAATFWNIVTFYWQWVIGRIHPGLPVPLSLILSATLGFILRASFLPWGLKGKLDRIVLVVVFLASFVLFPLAQMYCFGKTDYRRKADAIVVFGAGVDKDGTPSQALEDRVKTGVELYKAKLAPVLIFSGGPGPGAITEPDAMRALAMVLGVPDEAIMIDRGGLNTEATVNNTLEIFHDQRMKTALVVSHFYHLPRVKMTYARLGTGSGVEVFTVPAVETRRLVAEPYFMAREVAALWVYYLRPLFSHGR